MSRCLIIGARGQDGTILREQLSGAGHRVWGLDTDGLCVGDGAPDAGYRLYDPGAMARMLAEVQPEQIYFLAAYHHSAEQRQEDDLTLYKKSMAVHVDGLLHVLSAMADHAPAAHLVYAASSHVFKGAGVSRIDETVAMAPVCFYGLTKAAGVHLCRLYRDRGLTCSVAFLFNHESALRPPHFLSAKLVRGAFDVLEGRAAKVTVADPEAQADWGYAPDYMQALRLMADCQTGDDYVVASGALHSVAAFAQAVFEPLGLDLASTLTVDPELNQKKGQAHALWGDTKKLTAATGWRPHTSFEQMARLLVETEKGRRAHGSAERTGTS